MNLAQQALTRQVKTAAHALGLDHLGIAPAQALDAEAAHLASYLAQGNHGTMQYLARHFTQRTDPRELLPGAQTVLVALLNYYPHPADRPGPEAARLATYAWGQDYHHVLKHKLHALAEKMTEMGGPSAHRVCVDSAPIMEKAWAARAGLGWVGKNTCLIRPGAGSWFFLGEIITTLALAPDAPLPDHCGTCTRCLEACPTQALKPYELDARKCISYWNIEHKESLPAEWRSQMHGWAYGCDICQEVCPWNRFSEPHTTPELRAGAHVAVTPTQWQEMTPSQFKKLTRPTAMSRVRREKLQDTLAALTNTEAPTE